MDELRKMNEQKEMSNVYSVPKINDKSKKILKNKDNMSFIERSS